MGFKYLYIDIVTDRGRGENRYLLDREMEGKPVFSAREFVAAKCVIRPQIHLKTIFQVIFFSIFFGRCQKAEG